MAHYALLDENNIVLQVITGKDEGGDTDWEVYYGNLTGKICKRTSYNSRAGQHSMPDCTCFRKNYAGIGYTYDETRDAFIPPRDNHPDSYVLDADGCCWVPPLPEPADFVHGVKCYNWDDDAYQADNTKGWVEYIPPPDPS